MTGPESYSPANFEEVLPRLHQILYDEGLLRSIAPDEPTHEDETVVDVGALLLAVDQPKAERIRDELRGILALYPGTVYPELPQLEDGPSYIHMGAALDSQRSAFGLFALGEALGFWQVITPKKLLGDTVSDEEAADMMGRGFIMISGYWPDKVDE